MAYLFGAGVTDRIECGSVPAGTTWSLFVRMALTNNNATLRRFIRHRNNGAGTSNVIFQTDGATQTGIDTGFTSGGGTVFPICQWLAGGGLDSAGSVRYIMTYNQTTIELYANGGTAVATLAETSVPDTAGMTFCIGNIAGGGFTASADATIYEVGWWQNVVLTPTEANQIGTGGGVSGIATPTNYWPLVSNALDLFGGQHGTVTGATVVAHSGSNLWVAEERFRSITVAGLG